MSDERLRAKLIQAEYDSKDRPTNVNPIFGSNYVITARS